MTLDSPRHRSALFAEMADATDRVLETVAGLDEQALRDPSGLPGWTRGHVLAHLERNADGMANLVTWARTGVETPMYASREARNADIQSGAGADLAGHQAELAASAERLMRAFVDFPEEATAAVIRMGSGTEVRGGDLAGLRIRELEIHHVDLAAGYTPAHWSAGFATRTLDQLAPFFAAQRVMPVGTLVATDPDLPARAARRWTVAPAGPVLSGPRTALLAWLIGRSDGDGLVLDEDTPTPVPPAPAWV